VSSATTTPPSRRDGETFARLRRHEDLVRRELELAKRHTLPRSDGVRDGEGIGALQSRAHLREFCAKLRAEFLVVRQQPVRDQGRLVFGQLDRFHVELVGDDVRRAPDAGLPVVRHDDDGLAQGLAHLQIRRRADGVASVTTERLTATSSSSS